MAAADSVAGFKVPALGEMLRSSLRRGDSVAVDAAIEAMEHLGAWWPTYVEKTPSARHLRLSSTEVRPGWLVLDLGDALVRAIDEGLRSSAPHTEVDRLVDTFEALCGQCMVSDLEEETRTLMDQLAEAAMTTHQVVAPQTVNILSRPAASLTSLEYAAESAGRSDFAAQALALWTLVVTWVFTQYGHVHPMLFTTPQNFGAAPPWERAEEILDSRDFRERWVNQLHDREVLVQTLETARRLHAGEPLEVDEPKTPDASTRLSRLRYRLVRLLLSGLLPEGPGAEFPKVAGVPPPRAS